MKRNRIKLVAFDMEGCLTQDPTVWEIMHRKLESWETLGLPYWERYCAGELDYDEFARMDVAAWRGAPAVLYDEAAREVKLMPGCDKLLPALSESNVMSVIISNGLMRVASRFTEGGLGVFRAFANRLVIEKGLLTGELEIEVPYNSKGEILKSLAECYGLKKEEVAAVGDSTSDIAMFKEASLGIAFRPSHESVADAATHVMDGDDLAELQDIILGA